MIDGQIGLAYQGCCVLVVDLGPFLADRLMVASRVLGPRGALEAQRDVARKNVDDEDWVIARSRSDPSVVAKDGPGLVDLVDVTEIGD